MHDKAAGAGPGIQLGRYDLLPARLAGVVGARQAEDDGAVGQSGHSAALYGAGAYLGIGDLAEQLAKALHLLVKQRLDRLGCGVAAGKAGAPRDDHPLNMGAGNPLTQYGADLVDIILHQLPIRQMVARRLEGRDQQLARAVAGQIPGIRDSEYGQLQGGKFQ